MPSLEAELAVRAKRQLEGLGGKILGFVFNGVPVDSRRGYYGYAYYGYYAYGGAQAGTARKQGIGAAGLAYDLGIARGNQTSA